MLRSRCRYCIGGVGLRMGPMDLEELLLRIALAFGVGLLIGLERGWHAREGKPGSRAAGVRTFSIAGLLGGITAAVALSPEGTLSTGGGIVLGAAFVAFAGVVTVFGRDANRASQSVSATTTVVALLTFMLGAYALVGNVYVVAAAAVAATGILVIREELHGWVRSITLAELRSGLILLAMTFIVLPLLPDRSVGPFGGVNLREIWIIAIVLAAISFAGYIAVKVVGAHQGVLLASAIGGLVSSTAVTFTNARRALAGEGPPRLLAAGAALATAVSFGRVAVIVAVLKPAMLSMIAPAMLGASAAASAFALVRVRFAAAGTPEQKPVHFRNPFGFLPVVGMALAMGVLVLVGRLVYDAFGSLGTIAAAFTMGLFDVDAMTVSLTRLVPEPLDVRPATWAILTGVASNTFSKAVIGSVLARGTFAIELIAMSVASVVVGWLVVLLTLYIAPA
jgi:uncharacterized membrane protein (DUF4010 family)